MRWRSTEKRGYAKAVISQLATQMDIKTIASRIVYQNRWMTVREDNIERGDGSTGIYGVVDKPDFVILIPLQNDQIYLVEQFRYPVKERFWEFPQGSWEELPDVDPLEVARGELQEETGLRAGAIDYLGYLYNAYGYSSQGMHVFLATNLTEGENSLSAEEQDLRTTCVSIASFEEMIRTGQIKDASTLAAYNLLKMKRS
jgi:ADP-ribose pyrophosphatase